MRRYNRTYPDGVTCTEVFDAMRAAAAANDYRTVASIAKDRHVTWVCCVCIEEPAGTRSVPLPLTAEDAKAGTFEVSYLTHDEIVIAAPLTLDDLSLPDDHLDLPVCDGCYNRWRFTFVSRRYLKEFLQ